MTAPKKYPYKRRPRKSDPERQRKRAATQNPYLFVPQKPANPGQKKPEPKPKSIIRSLAARKPVPPANDVVPNQRARPRNTPSISLPPFSASDPWTQAQAEILEALGTQPIQVAVRSCNGAGKTFTAAIAIHLVVNVLRQRRRHHHCTERKTSTGDSLA